MSREIIHEGLCLIKRWEGLKLQAYRDGCGTLTIGYGHTDATGNPPKVCEDMTITESEAEEILRRDLRDCAYQVQKMVKVPLSDHEFAALVSFCYNVGYNNLRKSTLLRKLNLGRYSDVPAELMKWNKSGGKVVRGLSNRRAAEAGLWSRGSYVSSNYQEPDNSSVTYKQYAEMATPVVTALSGFGSMSMNNPPIQYALACVMVLGGIVGSLFLLKRMKDDRL